MKRVFLVGAMVSAAALSMATDPQYNFEWIRGISADPGINDTAGKLLNANGSFNTITNTFSWYGTYQAKNGVLPQGFWLAVSPGPNPKGSNDELAIFYLDGSSSNAKLYAYAYNGLNGGSSYFDGSAASGTQAPDRIFSSINDPSKVLDITVQNNTDGTRTLGFSINATSIQNHTPKYGNPANWTGAAFGPQVGIWWHPVAGLQTSTQDGWLTSYSFSKEGWFDGQNFTTTPTPEPATMIALGAGLLAFARRRRSK